MSSEQFNDSEFVGGAGCVAKAPTGIVGLDDVLHGGVPQGSLTLLSGGPGTGKTMLGLEFLVRGAEDGKPGVLLSFEETDRALRCYAAGFGWDIPALERANRLAMVNARIEPDAIIAGDFDLRGLLGILRAKVDAMGAERVVIDAPDVFLRLLDKPARERAELYAIHERLREMGVTALMTVKANREGLRASQYDFLDYMADCVIHLDQRVQEQITTRRLRVVKYRGSSYGRNEYPFGITDRGLRIIPVTQAGLKHPGLGEPVSTGVADLDGLLAGGYRRSSCTLITGGSGTGKTTFACSLVRSAVAAGERVLYLDFEESWEALVSTMNSPGIDLAPAMESGALRFLSAMPESQGVEEHLIGAFRTIDEFKPQHLIVDAISACRRMGSAHGAFDFLLRLINYCRQQGVTCLLTNLTASENEGQEITGIDLSSVIDTVIILRNVEGEKEFSRELIILKSRGRRHSTAIHPFRITDQGVKIEGEGPSDANAE